MTTWCRTVPLLLAGLLLAACQQYTLVSSGGPATIGDTYTVEPQIEWSKRVDGKRESWTVDGPILEQVIFFSGIEDGESLLSFPLDDDDEIPVFDGRMSALEVQDLFVASLSRKGLQDVDASGLRPADFGDYEGFRFEFTYLTRSGLEMKGLAIGAVHEDKLYMLSYYGAAIHYYPKYEPLVQRLIDSIRMVDT